MTDPLTSPPTPVEELKPSSPLCIGCERAIQNIIDGGRIVLCPLCGCVFVSKQAAARLNRRVQ